MLSLVMGHVARAWDRTPDRPAWQELDLRDNSGKALCLK